VLKPEPPLSSVHAIIAALDADTRKWFGS
jgi:hypothetical protein